MATGGSILAVSIAGRNFPVAADNDATRKLGGMINEVQANGDGSARLIKTREPLSVQGLQLECDDDRDDHQFLQGVANGNGFQVIGITLAAGQTWQGTAQITGDLQYSTQNSTASVNLMGPGELTKQI